MGRERKKRAKQTKSQNRGIVEIKMPAVGRKCNMHATQGHFNIHFDHVCSHWLSCQTSLEQHYCYMNIELYTCVKGTFDIAKSHDMGN